MIDIYHNILWSKYKGQVFSELYSLSSDEELEFRFFQIAETDSERTSLSGLDLSYHTYPYKLFFKGSYNAIPTANLTTRLFYSVWSSDSKLILLPGYHLPEYWAMLLAAVIKRKKRAVFCDSTIYDRPQTFFTSVLKRIFFSFCDGFFVYGERARTYVIHHGASPAKVFQRCQAAALPHSYCPKIALQNRIELAPSVNEPRFLYVGRLSPEKSLDVLLEAFAKVHRVLPAATFVLVGDGPQRKYLTDLSSSLGLVNAIVFTGGMDSTGLSVEYAKASCLVLPSISEPWGLVVNEALSYGCPVVVSSFCGCTPELVHDGVTGFSFESGSIDDLSAKLLRIPVAFSDIQVVANDCLNLISTFTSQSAAINIQSGCQKILSYK